MRNLLHFILSKTQYYQSIQIRDTSQYYTTSRPNRDVNRMQSIRSIFFSMFSHLFLIERESYLAPAWPGFCCCCRAAPNRGGGVRILRATRDLLRT